MLHILAPVVASTREAWIELALMIDGALDDMEGNGENDPLRGRN